MSFISHFEIIDYDQKKKTSQNMTKYMTKYEKARVLGIRAKQISLGSIINISINDNDVEPYFIALQEFNQKKINMILRRYLPDGSFEDWHINDLTTM